MTDTQSTVSHATPRGRGRDDGGADVIIDVCLLCSLRTGKAPFAHASFGSGRARRPGGSRLSEARTPREGEAEARGKDVEQFVRIVDARRLLFAAAVSGELTVEKDVAGLPRRAAYDEILPEP
jgi:hypothetical protein